MLEDIKGVGAKTLASLQTLGINNINDLIMYYPYRYNVYKPVSLVESERLSKRQAKKNLLEIAREAAEDVYSKWEYLPNSRMVTEVCKYIGEGDFYVIEKHKGSYVKGYEPYC